MHLTCSQTELRRALRLVRHAISLYYGMPILAHVLIETEGASSLRLSTTNLEIGITCLIEASVEQAGSLTVPVQALLAFLEQNAVEYPLTLRTEAVSGRDDAPCSFLIVAERVAFPGLDAATFPPVHAPAEPVCTARLPARLFKQSVAQVGFAASPDTSQRLYACVWFHLERDTLTLAAIDGSRYVQRVVSCVTEGANGELLFVPARTLLKMVRLLPCQGEVQLLVGKKGVLCVRSDRGEMLVRLSDDVRTGSQFNSDELVARVTRRGQTRPFDQEIPQRFRTLVCVSRKALRAAVKKQSLPVFCSLREEQGQWVLLLKVYEEHGMTPHAIPVEVWGAAFPPLWLDLRMLAEVLCCPGTASGLVLGFAESETAAILLRWRERTGMDLASFYVFKPLSPAGAVQHVFVRRSLDTQVKRVLAQTTANADHEAEERSVTLMREEVTSRIVLLLEHGLSPTEAEQEQCVRSLHELACQQERSRWELCEQHVGRIVQLLTVAAFAPGGSCLDIPLYGVHLAFDAEAIQAVLQTKV